MKKMILFLLCSMFLLASIKTVAVPKNTNSTTYTKVLQKLKNAGMSFKVIKIDFSKNPKDLKKKIEKKADILFVTGGDLALTLKKIKPNIKIVFLGVESVHKIPNKLKRNSYGVYRAKSIADIIKSTVLITRNNTKVAFICKKNSSLSRLSNSFEKEAQKNGIVLKSFFYDNKNEFDKIFKQLKKENFTSILLFPPSIKKADLPYLIKAQNKYKLPVFAQTMPEITAGLVGGITIDYENSISILVDDLIKLIKNETIVNKIEYIPMKTTINIEAISEIGVDINEDVLYNAKIVETKKLKKVKKVKPIKGDWNILISAYSPKHIVKKYLKSLQKYGLYKDKNVHIRYIKDYNNKKIYKNIDIIFATGNTFMKFYHKHLKIPIIVMTKKADIEKTNIKNRNFTGGIRVAFDRLAHLIKTLGYKKIGFILDSNIDVSNVINLTIKKANEIGIKSTKYYFKTSDEIASVFKKMKKDKIELVVLYPSSIKDKDTQNMIENQFRYNIPLFSQRKDMMQKGSALGADARLKELFGYLSKVTYKVMVKKERPDQYPIKFSEFDLAININSIKRLGIRFDKKTLQRAILYGNE